MNIREIQIDLHRNGNLHSIELVEYVNQRLDRRNTPSYKKSLFNIINRFLVTSNEHCDLRIFHCYHYNEIMIDENPIEFGSSLICQDAYEEHYFTCDNCNEVEHQDYRQCPNDSENTYCEGCYDDLTEYCSDNNEKFLNHNVRLK